MDLINLDHANSESDNFIRLACAVAMFKLGATELTLTIGDLNKFHEAYPSSRGGGGIFISKKGTDVYIKLITADQAELMSGSDSNGTTN